MEDNTGKKRKKEGNLDNLGKIKKAKIEITSSQNINMGKVPSNKDKINIDDPVFIISDRSVLQYVHCLVDNIGTFLFLKNYIPNLKIKIIVPKRKNFEFPIGYRDNFQKGIFQLLGFSYEECLLFTEEKNYVFSNVYDFSEILRSFAISNKYNFIFNEVKKHFIKFLTKYDVKKKYYISRSRMNDSRSIKNVQIFESYFKDKGYEVVFLEDLSFEEQANIFYNAEEIVSVIGTGLTNTIFCDPGTKILAINTSPDKYFWSGWCRISKEMQLNYTDISLMSETNEAEDLINKLKLLSKSENKRN